MKIAVSAQGPGLDAIINPRFGRCEYFVLVDTDTNQVESLPNENINATGGAGIQSATFIVSKGAQVLITGDVGPKALNVFEGSGVQIVTGQSGSVRQAVEGYSATPQSNPAVSSPAKPSTAMGAGKGMGGGRGMGCGGGRGMGGGGGKGMGGGRRRQQ